MDPTTSVQLDCTPTRLVLRGLFHRCPVCGHGGVIVRWFGIVDRCPTCSFKFERVDGQMVGYIGLNTIVCFTATFLVLIVGSVLMVPDIQPVPLVLAALVPAGLGPVLFLPSSRTMWTAIDLLLRPLQPGEADPRFIKVDPARDHPTAG